ncbi:MAG: mechanosensitive ion channel family protein [Gemmatimonadota bacterium]
MIPQDPDAPARAEEETAEATTETAAAFDIQAALGDAWSKVTGWVEGLVESLPNAIAALVVLLVSWGLARLARKVVRRIARQVADQPEINRLVAAAAYIFVLGLGLVLALGVLNLDKTVTSLLAGAGIIGLALGFAFQDIAENFIAGIILNVRNQFNEGDIVESGDYMGAIERVRLRATVMRTFTGQRVLIPNAQVFKNPIINYTQPGRRRVDIAVGVAYDTDLERARRVATDAVVDTDFRDPARDIEVFYTEFGDSSINFQLRFWIPFGAQQTEYLQARSDAIIRIKKAFDDAGIVIPFPIRTLDFAGGDVGGQSLAAAINQAGYRGP